VVAKLWRLSTSLGSMRAVSNVLPPLRASSLTVKLVETRRERTDALVSSSGLPLPFGS